MMPDQDAEDAGAGTGSARPSLTNRALHAAKWNYLGVLARIVIQLAAQVVLARFVGPNEFGYYSLVFMTVGIAYLLSEFGLSSALIQPRELSASDVRRVWSHLLASSVVAALVLFLSANPISRLLGLPEVADYLKLAVIPLTIQILSSVALALLRKNLDFKRIQMAQVVGMLVGQVGVGFVLAYTLHSALAILIGWTVQLAVAWGIMYWKVRHRVLPTLAPIGRNLSKFGVGAWTANVANWGIENLHTLIAGKLFGATTLGLYSVSSNLVRYPTNHLVTTLQSVMFPASAEAQGDSAALRAAYLAVLSLIALVTVPLFVAVAILAEPLILLLYGPDWKAAAELVQPLALAMPLHSVTAVSGPILWGLGRVSRESTLQWLTIICFVILLYVVGQLTAVKLSWIVLAIYALRACLISGAVTSVLDIAFGKAIAALQGATLLGVVSAIVAAMMLHFFGSTAPGSNIAATAILVLVASVILLWYFPTMILARPLAKAIARIGCQLPPVFLARISPPVNDANPD